MCHYWLGGCSPLVVSARRSRHVRGVRAGAGPRVSPLFAPLPPRTPRCVWRIVLYECPVSSPAGTSFHAVCAFRGSVWSPSRSTPRALCVCVRSRFCGARALPPCPGRCGARTTRRSRVGRRWGGSRWCPPLRVSCPGPVLRLDGSWEGWSGPFLPRTPSWAGLCVRGGPATGALGGGSVCRPPLGVWFGPGSSGGGLWGREVGGCSASFPPSAFIERHKSGLRWRRSVHGGCRLNTALLPSTRGSRGAP